MKLDKQTKEIMTNEIDLRILRALLIREYSLTELAKEVGIAYKNLLSHIKKLEKEKWLETEKNKRTRGQKVIVSSASDKIPIRNSKKAKKEILELIKELNKKATLEALTYLTNSYVNEIYKVLIKDLFNGGYVQAKFGLTKQGEKYLEELNKRNKSRF